jgi:hypothetical protein
VSTYYLSGIDAESSFIVFAPLGDWMSEDVIKSIEGAAELSEWFGYWPSFHDAEIIEVTLNRKQQSKILIHTWRMTSELDSNGRYISDHHVLVTLNWRMLPM